MCLAIPAQITALLEDNMAVADLGGVKRKISLALVDDTAVGDYVIVHVGYALSRLDPDEAEKTLELFAAMNEAGAREAEAKT
jgi:hydrogenase expression/formation protein HypC